MTGRPRAPLPAASCLALLLTTALAARAAPPPRSALLDSLAAWHRASDVARVDSLGALGIARARAAGDAPLLRAVLLARGRTRAAFGLARPAEPDLREALALATAARDTAGRLEALRWLSVSVGAQGRGAEARALYRELARLAVAAGDSAQLGWAWTGFAFDHYQAGRADSAVALYGAAAGLLQRAGVPRGALWAWSGQGLALRQAGRYDEAAAAFRRALAAARAAGDARNEATALNQLARLELQFGDPGRAVAMLRQAAAIHDRSHDHRESLLAAIDIAAAQLLQLRLDDAAAGLDSALTACRALGLRDLEILAACRLADVRLAQERPAAAAALCRRQLAPPAELPSSMAAVELRLQLARALAARDSAGAALAVLDEAAALGPPATLLGLRLAGDRGRLLLDVGRPAAALARVAPAVPVAAAAGDGAGLVALLTVAARAQLALDRPDSALADLQRAADAWEATRAVPADPAWREQRSAAAAELFAHGVATLLDHPRARPPAARRAAAFAFAQRYKARTLRERLRRPGLPVTPADEAVTLAAVRRDALAPGELLLDAVQGPNEAWLFCVTRDTVATCRLRGARELAPGMRRLEAVLGSTDLRDGGLAAAIAADLLRDLPPEARALLRAARRVYWCPDGSLHRLPLALLTGPGADAPLRADCEIVRLPSAGSLPRLRPSQLAIAPPARILALAGAGPAGGGPLPGAALETRWLEARLRGVTRLDAVALGPPGPDAWAAADIVHLAAHVRVDVQQPWNTAVVLHGGPGGELRAAEVAALPLHAALAVLSGCRTAGSRVVGGEGLLGLAAAFAAAGTPAVVATLWPVDDHVAARFMARFYAALAGGDPVGAALARARRECRADPRTAAPRHWAGFVLVGDPDVRLPVRTRPPRWPVAAALLAAAAACAWAGRRSGRA